MEIEQLEIADYDIIENIKTAMYRLWKMKLVVILVTIMGFLLFFVYIGVVGVHTSYYTSATIYSAVYGSYEDSIDGVTVMNKYSNLLGSSRVCERAASNLQGTGIRADSLRSMVSSGYIYLSGASTDSKSYGTRLTLVVRMDKTDNIMDIANAMAKAFSDEINDLLGIRTLQVFDEAVAYHSTRSINIPLYFVMFGALAFMLSVVVIFLKEFLSARVYSVAQCESEKDLILGMIPYKNS